MKIYLVGTETELDTYLGGKLIFLKKQISSYFLEKATLMAM